MTEADTAGTSHLVTQGEVIQHNEMLEATWLWARNTSSFFPL